MAVMHSPVWIAMLFTFIETTPAENLSVTACYNKGNCSLYGLNCSEGRKIRIMEAEYRKKKNNSCQIGNCLGNCCPLDENDCREDYSKFHAQFLYQWCSGKNECRRFNTPPSPNFYCTDRGEQYIQVKYQCIKETSIIDICDSSMAMGVSEVNIMLLKKTLSTAAVSRCTCQVQSEGKVNFELVDIRFFTSSDENEEYNCTSGNLIINNRSNACSQKGDDFIYLRSKVIGEIQRNTNDIQLIYSEDNKPAMVWINLKGSDSTFMITCTNHSSTTTTIPRETDTIHGLDSTFMITYTNHSSTTTTIPRETDTIRGRNEEENTLPTIIGVVIAGITVIAMVVVALILFRRKIQHKALKTSSAERNSPTRCTVAFNVMESINPNAENYASLDKSELGNDEYDQITHDYINTTDAGAEGGHIMSSYVNITAASLPDIHKVAEGTNRTKAVIF